jgi:hypothetical protein
MIKLFEVLTWAGAIFAFLLSFGTLSGGASAPQQAVAISFALALVVIPYCLLSMLQRKALLKRLSERA